MSGNTLGSLIWLRMVRFSNRSHQMTNEFLKRFELTTAQFDVLVQVHAFQPLNQTELARKVTVTQGGISRMLDRLERDGYIARRQDWKIKTIRLTDKGEAVVKQALPAQIAFQSSFFDEVLTREEQQALYGMMTRLQKHGERKELPPEK
ncbi:DNA-binding transcriptional regulator, MarR family [Paenibacillus sp. UNC496MF]|uniref:MarR family winged helix-turn-helix transcriptional regulator n=1 Tax=Paenibacillus sp. UNC496MF TaxID=1502753 RepID=UPI0008ED211B|nr:MarR family transcriptional regulator [Paenibacillus sp. UNC496MF]SFI72234.1 DNA-binding transcriptional regulator, MarR family [Paenibacillus sp. UNC496MF]